ncbi:MAG: metal ABC transporter solute-binding protein, Zn/Mn family, partial [Candidatus Tisiphia sp.]
MKITISASIFIAMIITLFNYAAFASGKVKIVTSITPLAAIIAMLVKDQAEIVAIANNDDCPHHYNLKPSDLKKVKDADIVFYIDEQFDGFVGKLMNGH